MIYCERFTASAVIFPFRGDQILCFGALDICAANKHTGHLHPRGGGARASHLTPGYVPCRLTACNCHNVTVLHYPSAANHVKLLQYPFGRKHCVPTTTSNLPPVTCFLTKKEGLETFLFCCSVGVTRLELAASTSRT